MSELTADTGTLPSEATVLMHMYRDVWAAEQDVATLRNARTEKTDRIEPVLDDFIDEHHLRFGRVDRVDNLSTVDAAGLGRQLIGSRLEERAADDSLQAAQQRLNEHSHELFVFSSSLIDKIVTIEAVDQTATKPPIRRMTHNYEDGWVAEARGIIKPISMVGVLCIQGLGLWAGFKQRSYRTRPIDSDGNRRVRLTIDSR